MSGCKYQNNPCEKKDCRFNTKACGLFQFLKAVDEDKEELIERGLYQKERELIEGLRKAYAEQWNRYKDSHAPGRATGNALEKWIRDQIKQKCGSGEVEFNFGMFPVDVAIPSKENARVILEVKVSIDTQHALALGGLLDWSPKNRKLGLVTFYDPKRSKKSSVDNILSKFKNSTYKGRFDYFVVQGGWSNTMQRLNRFCIEETY